ncbi:hypothetical protein [Marinovum sp.]|uniref:hypothetical protein n=1 Tax=Marinovum sp. TaxID=2024839 RepID=UPI003A94503C
MFTAVLPLTAPQTTGHPAALPQDLERRTAETRVTAAKPGAETGTAGSKGSGAGETPWQKARREEQASAPPTILQIKINSMLEEQQKRLAEEQQAREASPEAATPVPEKQADVIPLTPAAPASDDRPAPVRKETPPSPVSTLYAAAFGPEAPEPALSKAV